MRATSGIRFGVIGAIVLALGAAQPAAAQPGKAKGHDKGNGPKACVHGQAQLDRNTETAIAFYETAFNEGEPEKAVERYVGVDSTGQKLYIQHNPQAEDGPQAFIEFVNLFKQVLFPELHVDIVRAVAECDLVMTHSHLKLAPEERGSAVVDIFRFDNQGKIVEHWDVIQDIPADPANDNGMF